MNMRHANRLLAAIALVGGAALMGCENTTPTYDTARIADTQATSVTHTHETRVLYAAGNTDCVFTPTSGTAAMLAALLPGLIDTGLSTIKNAIDAAGKSASATVQGYVNLPADSPMPVCISIISGRFAVGPDVPAHSSKPPAWFLNYTPADSPGLWQHLFTLLGEQGVHLDYEDADAPDLYIEFKVIAAKSMVADKPSLYFKLVPTFISYRRPDETIQSVFRPDAVTDLNATISIGSADGSSKTSATVDLGYLTVGDRFRLNYERLTCPKHAASNDPCLVGPFVKESPWAPIALTPSQPLTVTGSVVETRTASATVAFLGSVFGSEQSTVSTAIQEAVIPSKARADKAAELEADAKIRTSYVSALKQAATDLLACDKAWKTPMPPARADQDALKLNQAQALATARIDEMNLNAAAIAAKKDPVFSTLVKSSDECYADYQALANLN